MRNKTKLLSINICYFNSTNERKNKSFFFNNEINFTVI